MGKLTLTETAPFDGCTLPINLGAARLDSFELGAITEIMPFQGQAMAVTALIKSTFGTALPKVGEALFADDAALIWFGQGQWLVFENATADIAKPLQKLAAVVDQTDGYVAMHLSGEETNAILARLCPLNFDALKLGQVARSDFAHISALFLPDVNGMRIIFPRSYARSAYESTVDVMKSIAAQKLL